MFNLVGVQKISPPPLHDHFKHRLHEEGSARYLLVDVFVKTHIPITHFCILVLFTSKCTHPGPSFMNTGTGKLTPVSSLKRIGYEQMEEIDGVESVCGAPRGFGDLGRMAIYFQGPVEHWLLFSGHWGASL